MGDLGGPVCVVTLATGACGCVPGSVCRVQQLHQARQLRKRAGAHSEVPRPVQGQAPVLQEEPRQSVQAVGAPSQGEVAAMGVVVPASLSGQARGLQHVVSLTMRTRDSVMRVMTVTAQEEAGRGQQG
jgi:hypothetical protein